MQKITKTFMFGDHEVTLETGRVARQADATVLVSMADTVVMVAAVGRKEANPGQSFFPLTVNYQEKFYAAGRIPGGFFKREGRPTEKEVLTCRLIDRPIRPLFPKGFMNEVQIVANVVSSVAAPKGAWSRSFIFFSKLRGMCPLWIASMVPSASAFRNVSTCRPLRSGGCTLNFES